MARHDDAAQLFDKPPQFLQAQQTGHRKQKGKLAYKLVPFITDKLIAKTFGVVNDTWVRCQQPATEFAEDIHRLEIAEQVDFLHSSSFYPWHEQDTTLLKYPLKCRHVACRIVVSQRGDPYPARSEPSRHLARQHRDICTRRQTRMKVQVAGDLQHELPQPKNIELSGNGIRRIPGIKDGQVFLYGTLDHVGLAGSALADDDDADADHRCNSDDIDVRLDGRPGRSRSSLGDDFREQVAGIP